MFSPAPPKDDSYVRLAESRAVGQPRTTSLHCITLGEHDMSAAVEVERGSSQCSSTLYCTSVGVTLYVRCDEARSPVYPHPLDRRHGLAHAVCQPARWSCLQSQTSAGHVHTDTRSDSASARGQRCALPSSLFQFMSLARVALPMSRARQLQFMASHAQAQLHGSR